MNSITGLPNTKDEILLNQGAECLYLVIMNACGDGESRGQFSESDIGDTDGDGAPEFVDSWGHPIDFLRWAPGYASDAQMNVHDIGSDPRVWQASADADHDPFDVFRRDRRAFRLQPLIYSAGSDERYGIERNDDPNQSNRYWSWYPDGIDEPSLSPNAPYVGPPLTPYEQFSLANYTGTPIDRNGIRDLRGPDSTDNIHSHLIGTRAE